MTITDIKDLLDKECPLAVLGLDESATPQALIIDPLRIVKVCEVLHTHKSTYFDMLSSITGIDNGVEANSMDVAYNLCSLPYNLQLMLKCRLDRENPNIDTVSDIWKTANWHERETFDLLGIRFNNHPDLRRILLPTDWEGHPLRKDYQEQEKYHGITVKYDRDEEVKS